MKDKTQDKSSVKFKPYNCIINAYYTILFSFFVSQNEVLFFQRVTYKILSNTNVFFLQRLNLFDKFHETTRRDVVMADEIFFIQALIKYFSYNVSNMKQFR